MSTLEALLGIFLLANQPLGISGHGEPEPALDITPDAIIIKAASHGCTQKRHFRLVQDSKQGLRVQRIKEDRCQQPLQLVEFHYSYQQLGLNQPLKFMAPRIASNH
jgi:hypothetical protein